MPQWLITLLVKLAVAVGIPYLAKKFPNLPKEVWDMIEQIIKFINASPDPAAATRTIQEKVNECTGPQCSARI